VVGDPLDHPRHQLPIGTGLHAFVYIRSQPRNGPAGGFADALKSALDGVNSTQQNAENITSAYERGEVTDVAKVMLARQEAGVAFEATLQVRNRLLSAYQEIMRMGV
jgi:flagellar hook-basal body complex protein FliE